MALYANVLRTVNNCKSQYNMKRFFNKFSTTLQLEIHDCKTQPSVLFHQASSFV